MSEICDVIAIFRIYGQFGAIWKPYTRRMTCKTYISTNTFYLKKTEKRTKKSLTQLYTIPLIKGTILTKKRYFLQKNADISKIKWALVLKGIFFEITYE